MTRRQAMARRRAHACVRPSAMPIDATRRLLLVVVWLMVAAAVFAPRGADAVQPPVPAAQRIDVVATAPAPGDVLVTLGIPFPPGALHDIAQLGVVDAQGRDVPAYVAPVLTWHRSPGGIRAVRVQFRGRAGRYGFTAQASQPARLAVAPMDAGWTGDRPLAVATLTPQWLTASLIAGPQSVATPGEAYARYVDGQFAWAKALPADDATAWLFDRPSTLFKAYVRTGRADYLLAAEQSYRWYMKGIRRDGPPASPVCGGGWQPTGKPCDVKYVYIEPILLALALAGDDSQHDTALVRKMADLWASGGWNGAPGPYATPHTYFTERLAGLGLVQITAAYEITGDDRDLSRIDERIGWLQAHQAHNPDGLGDDGSWRNSWNVHENDPEGAGDVRGSSPWMSENIVDGLWHAWLVTRDPRIPPMLTAFGRYLERYGWIDPARLAPPHDWRNDCSGPGGQIAWYWSSSVAPRQAVEQIQETEGWYSDGHTVELGLPVAAAYYFEQDAAQAARLKQRFHAIAASYSAACAAIADTARRFNWNNRGAGVAQWMIAQPPGSGLADSQRLDTARGHVTP
jgi:hypothetical protein